jgi:hypothetical protein
MQRDVVVPAIVAAEAAAGMANRISRYGFYQQPYWEVTVKSDGSESRLATGDTKG